MPKESGSGAGAGKKPQRTKRKLTRKDVFNARDGDLPAFIKTVVKRMKDGDADVKQQCAAALMHIAQACKR